MPTPQSPRILGPALESEWPGFPVQSLASDDPLEAFGALRDAPAPARVGSGRSSEIESLRRVLATLGGALDPATAVRSALECAVAETGVGIASLWLFQPGGRPVRACHVGLSRAYLEAFAATEDWPRVQAEVLAEADVRIVDCTEPSVPPPHRALDAMAGITHVAVVPLRARDLRVGALVLGSSDVEALRSNSASFLRSLGEVIATALDNARVIAELKIASDRQAVALRGMRDAEGRARDAHALLAQMLDALDIGVVLVASPLLEVLECNPAFASLVRARGVAAGTPLGALVPGFEQSALETGLRRATRERRPVSVPEFRLTLPDGSPASWSFTVAPLPSAPGEPATRVMVVATDVTEHRAVERRHLQAQRLEAVGQLAGGIAHEFNNLLTAILGNVSIALLELPAEHSLAPGLRDCETAAQRAADLTRQLLGFGRRSQLSVRPTDLNEVVRGSLPLLSRVFDPRIGLAHEADADLWRVEADPAQMEQALMNLAVNARDAMPDGGRLVVTTRNVRRAREPGDHPLDHVLLEIADTGTGIEPEVLPRIWEPFFTTKGPDRGTGLGLASVHGIVEQHGGWVECETQVGRGSAFRIFLPRAAGSPAGLAAPRGRGETVLVVDDEEAVRSLARSVLERLGYRVVLAADGPEALRAVERRGSEIALVVLDRTMPLLSGRETLARIRALAPGTAVVLSSGYEPETSPDAGLDPLADGFLSKPYAPDQLGQLVRATLDSRARAADTPPRAGGSAA